MLRYSDKATFSVLEDDDPIQIFNPNNTVPDAALLMKILNSTMTEIASAASKMSGKKFATKQKSYMPANPLYCLVQCTPDLSENDCNRCLQKAIVNLPNDTAGAKMLSESCYLRYELFPFYENIDTLSPSITSPSVPKVMKKKGQPFKAIIIISAVLEMILKQMSLCNMIWRHLKLQQATFPMKIRLVKAGLVWFIKEYCQMGRK